MNQVHYSTKSNEWATPQWLFEKLNAKYRFTLDPCATNENAKCDKYYTINEDGLSQDWQGEIVFCNPPYGRELPKWIKKCADEAKKGVSIVMLIPARTDTKAFHEYIYKTYRIEFIKGRLKFGESKNSAPFPSMLVFMNCAALGG